VSRRHGDGGEYGRLFPALPPAPALGAPALEALSSGIPDRVVSKNDHIPAGFTYLAQFVDHDLTFNPTPPGLTDEGAANLRTPRLDLDSLYGTGPLDQPYLYDRVHLVLGGTCTVPDLPRLNTRAIIGDPRNDEHLLIAQLHLLFLRFHNAVVDYVRETRRLEGDALFAEAQRVVRWHYQWIVLHDLLDRILGPPMACEVRERRRFFDGSFIPVEFSGAAYRFAHSMVRSDYPLNTEFAEHGRHILPEKGDGPLDHLLGRRPLPARLQVEWPRFFGDQAVIFSRLIKPRIAKSLQALPTEVDAQHRALQELDLLRAQTIGLPSGLDVARAMGAPALTGEQIHPNEEVRQAPPLWYYILAEADQLGEGGRHLGPVGGRIVGEVLVGLVASDPTSYLCRWPSWTPWLPAADDHEFTMQDLVNFTR
jgi:hypothetical protein